MHLVDLLTLALIAIALIALVLRNLSRWLGKQPPGPWNIPLIGSAVALLGASKNPLREPYAAMANLSRKYGGIMTVGLGNETWIVLSGLKEIKEFSMKSEAVSRPVMPSLNSLYAFNEQLGVIFADGRLWSDQRRFMAKSLKVIQTGYKPFGEHIMDEFNLFRAHLLDESAKCPDFNGRDFFDIASLNIIWRLAVGERFDYKSKVGKEMINHVEAFTMEQTLGIIGGVAYARYMPYLSGVYRSVEMHMEKLRKFLWEKAVSRAERGNDDDCNYAALFHQSEGEFATNKQLVVSLLDFFTGGSGTVSKTMSFALLFMLHYPKAQEKVRREALAVATDEEEIGLEHASSMPYTEAFLLEVQRLASVLPICPPRVVTKATQLNGYTLREGQKVQMNLFAMHRDPDHWGDPENFRPERFLDEQGRVTVDEWLQPFGYGKRKCVGESIAKTTVFLFICNLVKHFDLLAPKVLPGTAPNGGLTLTPENFIVRLQPLRKSVTL
uniref:Cytochrome P450 3076A2 n=1 Tax=Paracyclopina nana TaxID=565004 RepID=A0A0F7J1U4_PARNA|nr:cytochrome P450 3076A2 [Paracyclopina nana]